MAVLSDTDRSGVWAAFMRESGLNVGSLSKEQLRAAVNAVDDWVEANTSSFNTAIPQPARGAMTSRQKAALLEFVVNRRFEVS